MENVSSAAYLEDAELGADESTWQRWQSVEREILDMHTNNDFPLAHMNAARFLLALMEMRGQQQQQQEQEQEQEQQQEILQHCWYLLNTDLATLNSSLTHLVTALRVAYKMRDLSKIDTAMKWTMQKIFTSADGTSIPTARVRSSQSGAMVTTPTVSIHDILAVFMMAPHLGRWSDFIRLGNTLLEQFPDGRHAMKALQLSALANPYETLDYLHTFEIASKLSSEVLRDAHLTHVDELDPQVYELSDVRLLHLETQQDVSDIQIVQEPMVTCSRIDDHVFDDPTITYTEEELDQDDDPEEKVKWVIVDHEMPSIVLHGFAGMWFSRSANYPLGCAVVLDDNDGQIQSIYMKGSREFDPEDAEREQYDASVTDSSMMQRSREDEMQDAEDQWQKAQQEDEAERQRALDESMQSSKLVFSEFELKRDGSGDPTRFVGTHKRGMTLAMRDGKRTTTTNIYKMVARIERRRDILDHEEGDLLVEKQD